MPIDPQRRHAPRPCPIRSSLTVSAYATADPASHEQYATLQGKTFGGAGCSAPVGYLTGRSPVAFNGSAQTVGSGGTVNWSWYMESKGSGGTATASRTYRCATKSATARFTIG